MTKAEQLLTIKENVDLADQDWFRHYTFNVPADATRLTATLDFVREDRLFLHLQLFDAQGQFRGRGFSYNGKGQIHIELPVWLQGGPPRGLPGPLWPGEWIAEVEIRTVDKPAPYHLQVVAELDSEPVADVTERDVTTAARHSSRTGWVRGDLHAHTNESDGTLSVAAAVAIARERGLDFLALSEHNTNSGWRHYPQLEDENFVLLHAEEMTTGYGHGVAVGLKEWLDWRVGRIGDDTVRGVNDVMRHAREQGAIFFPAHPFIPNFDWRFMDTDWSLVTALEVWGSASFSGSPGPTLRALGFWDVLLGKGYRIWAVGGSDAHRLDHPWQTVGIPFTYVHVDSFDEQGIVEGIRQGRIYVTLGPEMEFTAGDASTPERKVMMGQELTVADKVALSLQVRKFHGPLRVVLFRDGQVQQRINQPERPDGQYDLQYEYAVDRPCYYRVEIHRDPGRDGNEDASTLLAFSNPIFVGPKRD